MSSNFFDGLLSHNRKKMKMKQKNIQVPGSFLLKVSMWCQKATQLSPTWNSAQAATLVNSHA
jgi:hypothetical protein